MLTLIASDNQPLGTKLRDVLLSQGNTCPLTHVVSIDSALQVVGTNEGAPQLILIDLSPDIDRSLAVLHELREKTSAKLVAIGPARDPKQILQVVHAGPDDYLDEEGDLENDLRVVVNRLNTVSRPAGSQGRIFTVMSPSGGSGCSMLATNLAAAFAQTHRRCGLFDMDLQRGDLASLLNLKPRHTIIDLCRNLKKLDQGMFEKSLLEHETGIRLLAAPQTFAEVQQVTSEAAERIMQLACISFPYVVADLEDFFHREQFRVLQVSHMVFFVLRLDFSALRNARRTLNHLEKGGLDLGKLQLVANQYGRPKELTAGQAEEVLGMKIAHYIPDDPKTVVSSINCGVPAVVDAPRSRLARAVIQMAERVSESVPV